MKAIVILTILCSGLVNISAQNQLDEQGRKTGPWKVEYDNGKTLYEGEFREGKPVGLMLRYYDSGALRARMTFDPDGERSYAEMFYKNGKKAAEGRYIKQDKDSVWTYYSQHEENIRMREAYISGKLDGISYRYYPSGQVSEEVSWVGNSREGSWKQYFEDGSLRLHGLYQNNMLNGPYLVYYGNGKLMMEGKLVDDLSEGTWSYYTEEGELQYTLDYLKGRPLDTEKYIQLMQDTLVNYDSIKAPQPVQFF